MAVLGAVIGTTIGWGDDTVLFLTVLGGAAGAAGAALTDRVKGYRLLKWIRDGGEGSAPRDATFWGELGYRFERSLLLARRETEAERANRRDFLSAIEASPNGVLLLDKNFQIEWCNSVAADHFSLDPVRDALQRITNLVRDPVFVAFLHKGQFDEPLNMSARGGRLSLSVVVRTYGAGRSLVLSQDVTERERAEVMRRDFVANVSHEIRTPLTVLSGFVESLTTLHLSDDERLRVLGLMTQQTQRMEALVTDLLTLAQLEGSPLPVADRWVRLADLFTQVEADALALSGGRHNLTFGSPGDWELAGDRTELQSALGNLLSNAIRYTPQGGSVTVAWRAGRPLGGGTVEVVDTGPGIAREHISRLTERFYRAESSRSRETGGTGLGLSIVKHVMQRHGGEVEIESEVGRGSRFRLVFPPVRVSAGGAPLGSASQGVAGPQVSARDAGVPVVDNHQLTGGPVAPLRGHNTPSD